MQRLRIKRGGSLERGIMVAVASMMLLLGINVRAQHGNGPSSAGQTAVGTDALPQVIIDNYAFSPASLTVKVGTMVTWINHDDDPHTVDSSQGKFKSATLNKGSGFEFRFTEAGEYPFFCRFHPNMTGKIIVQR